MKGRYLKRQFQISEKPKLVKDITGLLFGKLTVLSYWGKYKNWHLWNTVCECGRPSINYGHQLKDGKVRSCGCLKSGYHENRDQPEFINFENDKLAVIDCKRIKKHNRTQLIYICRCKLCLDTHIRTAKQIKNNASVRECKFFSVHNKEFDSPKDRLLQRNYGITKDDYDALLVEQNGVCAICKMEESKTHNFSNKIQDLSVDHCHKSGKVRGLLCHRCNTLLGLVDDNKKILLNSINYLNA